MKHLLVLRTSVGIVLSSDQTQPQFDFFQQAITQTAACSLLGQQLKIERSVLLNFVKQFKHHPFIYFILKLSEIAFHIF